MVRPDLDYCSSVWASHRKGDIEALEKVQKRARKILPGLKYLHYSELAAHALAPLALSAARCEQCRFVPEMIA